MRNIMCLLLLAVMAFAFGGCSTMPVQLNNSLEIPQERIIAKELTQPDSIRDTEIIFIRDEGLIGSGCYAVVSYQRTIIAKLNPKERFKFYLPEGEHLFSIRGGDRGLCAFGPDWKHIITIRKARSNMYRIMLDPNGTCFLLPTGHSSHM